MVHSTKQLLVAALVAVCLKTASSQVCPFGWLERPGSDTCYLLSADSTKYKFPEAVDKCGAYQGQVLIFNSTAEQTWVLKQLQSISSAYSAARAWWLGLQYANNKYQWLDGAQVQNDQIPWIGGKPSHAAGQCYVIQNQKVVSSDCAAWNNVMCTRPKSLPLSCEVDNLWTYINGSCFKTFNDSRSWEDAKSLCELQDAHLATVTTFMEHSYLWDAARNTVPPSKVWTGLTVQLQAGQLALVWVDGTGLDPSPVYWNDSQPGQLGVGKSMVIDGTVPRRLKSWFLTNNTDLHHYTCQKPQGVCEEGWMTHQSKCFKIFDMDVAWSYASFVCSAVGGQLVNLASPSDQQFIQRYLPEIKATGHDSFWIGISDAGNDNGPFKWTDGTVVVNAASHWAVDPPPKNTAGSRDCGFIDTNDDEGRWQMTSDCLQQRTFVCTIPVNVPVKAMPITPAPSGQCDSGWQQATDKCYFFSDTAVNWQAAKQACGQQGAVLAVIKTEADQTFINGHMSTNTNYWFGLNDIQTEGTWMWVDGSQLSQPIYWASSEPNGLGGEEDCGSLWGTRGTAMKGQWNDEHCGRQQHYVCQKPPNYNKVTSAPPTTTPKAIVYSQKCGPNWEERPNSDLCYQFHDEVKRHEDALATCQSYNGSLVSITDHVEQSYLAGRVHSMTMSGVWLGATDSSVEGGWTWIDGSPFAFVNWAPDEPNNLNDAQDCAAMITKDTLWHDFNCRLKLGFICKKYSNTHTTTAVPTTTPLPLGKHWTCPRGYLAFHGQCYVTHSTALTWSDAQKACRTDGAELASIANIQDNDFIFSRLPSETCSNNHDNDTECTAWAEMGECERNPVWMRDNCKEACKHCDKVCLDSFNHHQCRSWAENGECTKNPIWMFVNCARSCKACGGDGSNLTGWWLGLNELQVKGSFMWSDQSRVTFTNWHANMPLSFPTSSCGVMTKVDGGKWVNGPCEGFAKYVCQKPLTVADVTSIQPYKVGCPVRSIGLGAYCYNVVSTKQATWQEAEAFCNKYMASHLATINSVIIQSFVVPELDLSVSKHYWIGLNDIGTPGTYTWSSGLPVLYSAWNANHTGNEKNTCAAMQTRRPIGLWQSLDCNLTRPFVCQYPRSGHTTPVVTTPALTTTPPPCPSGWSGFEDHCYTAITPRSSRKSWTDARDFCRSYGGDLASIHNNTLNDFFKAHVASYGVGNYWIGLTDADTEGTYEWSDGSPVQYSKWYPGEPNNAGGNEDCAEYNYHTNSWNDNSCYLINAFICSVPRGKPLVTTLTPPTTTPVPTCDSTDWLSRDGYCYYVSPRFGSDSVKTWFEARRFCQKNGAELASIQSADVNSFIVHFLTKRDSPFNHQYWIGFNKLGGVNYEWSDKSPVVFTSWSQSEPNDAYGGQSCSNMYALSGKWNDDNCNDKFHFICKRINSSSNAIPPVPTPLIRGGCPPGFSGIGNKCFKVVGFASTKGMNYTEARDTCRAISAKHPVDIASITTEQQQAFVMTLLEGVNSSVYIGLNDRHLNNHFEWQNNEEVTLTYWAAGQPSERWARYGTAEEDCVVMKVNEKDFGQWDDVYCGSLNGYVCQTTKDPSYPIKLPDNGGCKSGYFHYRDSCYGSYKMPKSWSDAESMCQMDGGHLVSLRDIHELSKVDLFTSDAVIIGPVWIGLSFQQNTGQYAWLDGWPVTLTRWDKGEPDMQNAGSCVKMNNGVWNDTACNETNPFVCKISSVTPPPTTPPPPGYCGDPSWAQHGDYCYFADIYNKQSWPEANYICQKKGMEVLSLHSANELDFVQSLTNLVTTPRYSYLRENRVWLGLQRTLEGGFRWSDKSPTDYFSWNQGEPNNEHEEEDCAELLIDSGKWNDIACIGGSQGQRGYICKASRIIPSTSTVTTTTTTTPLTTPPAGTSPRAAFPTFVPPRITANPVGTTAPLTPTMFTKNTRDTGSVSRITGQKNSNSNTLSGGEIAGIVIGLIGLIIIVAAVVFVFHRRRSFRPPGVVEHAPGFDNALYFKSQDDEEVSLSRNGTNNLLNGSNRLSIVNHADEENC